MFKYRKLYRFLYWIVFYSMIAIIWDWLFGSSEEPQYIYSDPNQNKPDHIVCSDTKYFLNNKLILPYKNYIKGKLPKENTNKLLQIIDSLKSSENGIATKSADVIRNSEYNNILYFYNNLSFNHINYKSTIYNPHFPNLNSEVLVYLTMWQYWWWFWFVFLSAFYYVFLFKMVFTRQKKFNPRINTSLKSHGRWGDLIIGLIPIYWCLNILINSNFLLKTLEWQTESNVFTFRIRGKQWYWVYKIDVFQMDNLYKLNKNVGNNNILHENTKKNVNNLLNLFTNKLWNFYYYRQLQADLLNSNKNKIKGLKKFNSPNVIFSSGYFNSPKDTNLFKDIDLNDIKELLFNNSDNNVDKDKSDKTFEEAVLDSIKKHFPYFWKVNSARKLKPHFYFRLNCYPSTFRLFFYNTSWRFKYKNLKRLNFFYYKGEVYDRYFMLFRYGNVRLPNEKMPKWKYEPQHVASYFKKIGSYEYYYYLRKKSKFEDHWKRLRYPGYVAPPYDWSLTHLNLIDLIDDPLEYDPNSAIPDWGYYPKYKFSFQNKIKFHLKNFFNYKNRISGYANIIKKPKHNFFIFDKNKFKFINLYNYNFFIDFQFIKFSKSIKKNFFFYNLKFSFLNKFFFNMTSTNLSRFFYYKFNSFFNNNIINNVDNYIVKVIDTMKNYNNKIKNLRYLNNSKKYFSVNFNKKKTFFITKLLKKADLKKTKLFYFKLNLTNIIEKCFSDKFRFEFYKNYLILTKARNKISKKYFILLRHNYKLLLKTNVNKIKSYPNNMYFVIKQTRLNNFSKIKPAQWKINKNTFSKFKNKNNIFNDYVKNNFFFLDMSTRLLTTNFTLVLPSNLNLATITNSYDVIHSWFVPGLGIKMDCVPGRSTHHTFYFDTHGLFLGQCAEVCGRFHHHMPIKVALVHYDLFLLWVNNFLFYFIFDKHTKKKKRFFRILNYIFFLDVIK